MIDFELKRRKEQPIYLRCKVCSCPVQVGRRESSLYRRHPFALEFFELGPLEELCDSCGSANLNKYTLFDESYFWNKEAVFWYFNKRLVDQIKWRIRWLSKSGSSPEKYWAGLYSDFSSTVYNDRRPRDAQN